jgi:stearoyl-CoA desaturase (delta-9 desaturase)
MHKGIKMVFWRGVELYREARTDREIDREVRQGLPGRLDRAQGVYAARHDGSDAVAVHQLRAVRRAWHRAVGPADGVDPVLGRRRRQRPRPLVGLLATSKPPTPRPTSPRGAVWIGGEELHNNHHAFPSSAKFALRKWEFDIGWATIKLFESVGLAKVLRVAPSLDVRPNIHVPDGETMKALLAHRFQAMTDYHRNVLKPALREEAKLAGEKLRRVLPRQLRKGLTDDGRWLKPDAREQLNAWVAQRPRIRALVEHRARLAAVLEARGNDAAATLQNLQAWCREAEASGNRALQDFSARLKGYQLQAG